MRYFFNNTYVTDALNQQSIIDYSLCSNVAKLQYYIETGSLLQSLLPSLNDAEDNLSCSPDDAPVYVEQI